ncbi:hypothetical protein PhCBS80983_g02443 [Powellomyces hirtus]|uniref:RanBP2-type domain-containing protein n=1 Tax=Powellomyces hirtus TaxID=109895 RepID=A0A507E6H9_9FUNG|nr:hypothetical protein PhCBS80983_g02443 [Powellomyces hirtus]
MTSWNCEICTFANEKPLALVCEICGALKPAGGPALPDSTNGENLLPSGNVGEADDSDDEDLRLALALSVKESNTPQSENKKKDTKRRRAASAAVDSSVDDVVEVDLSADLGGASSPEGDVQLSKPSRVIYDIRDSPSQSAPISDKSAPPADGKYGLASIPPAKTDMKAEGETRPRQSIPDRAELERQRLERIAGKRSIPMTDDAEQAKNGVKRLKKQQHPEWKYPGGFTSMTYVDGSLPGSCLRFEDLVVRKHLQRAVLSGFQVDHNWLMSKLPTSTKICFLRFVVTSANLVDYDWEQQENVIWVQDFPIPEEDSHPPPSDFSKDLEEILSAMEVPANVRLAVMKADFSSAKAKLCFSRPGSFSGSSLLMYGHLRLSEIVKELAIQSLERHQETMVTYQTSSLGALSPSWIKEFHRSACGKRPASTEADAIPLTEILFPSSATVAKSKLGPNGAGTICFARKAWERPDFPQQVLRNSVSKRPGTLSHSKIILVAPSSPNSTPGAGNDEIVGWYYCGSHNSTQSAWGALWRSKRKGKQTGSVADDDELAGCTLRIRNWELGVVFPMTRNQKSAINGGFDLVVPFQYPAAPYAQDDTPWFK